MKFHKILLVSLLSVLFMGCGGSNKNTAPFVLKLESKNNHIKNGDWVTYAIINKSDVAPDSLVFKIDGKVLVNQVDSVSIDVNSLGNKTIEVAIKFKDGQYKISEKIQVFAKTPPSLYTYKILNTYPHDRNAYTQGLEFYNDTLYESTGLKGFSSLRKLNYKTGEILKKISLPDPIFGEGISILNNKIYMLSWQSGKGFVFDLNTFEQISQFTYGQSKEGWGLCNDGSKLFKSDGSQKIWTLDPISLKELDHIELVTHKGFFKDTNELEYVDGYIYANVYQKESVMIINASSGAIEGVVNFSGLKKLVTQHSEVDVLNGIAYHPGRKTFFVTGKKWDKLFEVSLEKK
ncbi:MAG: glutaminyl-peptide cyclotransferase [Flavobacteriaceae bacterium]|tara:strand:- start:14279 stop:15319 length:1041 start_codon:yes stop_codon:yes gene_type:complete